MSEVNYKQGMTQVWCDGEKTVITNPSGKAYIKDNVERIFGMGEFDKLYAAKYSEKVKAQPINPLAKHIEIVSGYIPERAKKDLAEKSLPGLKDNDLFKFKVEKK